MSEKLNTYNLKRNFERTLEPEGKGEAPQEGLRFVVQLHASSRKHYDFRLEWDGVLLSWAVPKGPSYHTRDRRLAIRVEAHPLEYRNFEGTIPKGEYGGGAVMLWDEGWWEPYTDVEAGLREGSLKFTLKGKRLKGRWALVRLKGKGGETKENWLLLKEKDHWAREDDGVSDFDTSIRSGRTMAEIERGAEAAAPENSPGLVNPFQNAEVQLAALVSTAPQGGDWLYELKYDGYRALAFVEGGSVRLVSRNGNDYTRQFWDAAVALSQLAGGRAMVLDGEMAVIDPSGRTDFQALQNYMKNPQRQSLTYIVFDLLALDGEDLRGRPLIERKEMLEALMKDAPKNLYYSRHVRGREKESFAAACEAGLEGIIGKKADSPYSGTRNGDWVKLKCAKRQEFVIGGYTLTDKRASGVSALLLGVYDGEELVYVGRAGTGFSDGERKELGEKFESRKRASPPFKPAPQPRAKETITWLEPELIAEIEFAQWTEENLLRQARFKGLRRDKDPREIKKETEENSAEPREPAEERSEMMEQSTGSLIIQGVKITNPDKVLFDDPKTTKADVVRYYEAVAERMLPYAGGRVLSILRCPKGISQSCFYKKHPGPGSGGGVTISVPNSEGEEEEYFYIENTRGLISEAQMGTLEFHIWGSRADALETPDMMVFDLDPDEGMDLDRIRQGVRDLREILSELSLKAYLKTSGGKGYHVVVPLRPSVSWEVFHGFARGVAEVMEKKWPDRYTSNVRKVKRSGKIFIDWIRNGRGATSVAPYSIRARSGAKVSMPIAWEELDTVAPDGVTMADALIRIGGGDPWKDFFQNDQTLK